MVNNSELIERLRLWADVCDDERKAADVDVLIRLARQAAAALSTNIPSKNLEGVEGPPYASDDWAEQGYLEPEDEIDDMARVGRSLIERIAEVTKAGPMKGWAPADDPAEIVIDMANMLSDAALHHPSDTRMNDAMHGAILNSFEHVETLESPSPSRDETLEEAWNSHVIETWGWTEFAKMHTQSSGKAYKDAFYAGFNRALRSSPVSLDSRLVELGRWRECALYDATMEGPVFKGWDRSALDRCRKEFVDTSMIGEG